MKSDSPLEPGDEDPAADALVATDAKIEKLAGDMKFTEGPV